jgi:hypothetical protein
LTSVNFGASSEVIKIRAMIKCLDSTVTILKFMLVKKSDVHSSRKLGLLLKDFIG